MTTAREAFELQLIQAQTILAQKQSKTEYVKVWIALVVAGAIAGGFIVGLWK